MNRSTDYFVIEYHIYRGQEVFFKDYGPYTVREALELRDKMTAESKTNDCRFAVEPRDK